MNEMRGISGFVDLGICQRLLLVGSVVLMGQGTIAETPGPPDRMPLASVQLPYLSSLNFGSGISVEVQTGVVHVPPGISLDIASKQFWNMVAAVRGAPPPFPEAVPP